MKSHSVTIHVEATKQYPAVVLYKVVLTFEALDKTLKCDHSNEGN